MLCFKNLGIMNNETLRKAQQNTRKNELPSIQGMQDMAFPRVQFSKIFLGNMLPDPPILVIRAFGAENPLVSPITLCLVFSYKKTPCQDKKDDYTKSE